jgi:hypothetical protein
LPGLENAIKTYLSNSQHDEPAWKIAKDLGANRNSVRVFLSRLYKTGVVDRPKTGYYCIKPGYAVGDGPWREVRVQHLHFYADGVKVRAEDWGREEVISFPEVSGESPARVRIEFGGKRSKLHWWVKADAGLDFYGLSLARLLIEERLLRLGYSSPGEWVAEGWETLSDRFGIRMEGVSCVTYSDVSGWLEKHYNKGYGVRRELRAPSEGDATLNQLTAMMQGGINYGQLLQSVAVTNRNVDRMMNYLEQQSRIMNAILDRLGKV